MKINCSIGEALFQLCRSAPDADALREREQTWTRRRLLCSAAQLARDCLGPRSGRRVALLFDNSLEMNLALLAVWLAGGIAVPLNPRQTAEQNAAVIRHCAAAMLLSGPDHNAHTRSLRQTLPRLKVQNVTQWLRQLPPAQTSTGNGMQTIAVVRNDLAFARLGTRRGRLLPNRDSSGQSRTPTADCGSAGASPSRQSNENYDEWYKARNWPKPDDPAAIFYTSGTTGRPKGVLLSHRNLLSNAAGLQRRLQLGPADRVLQILPLFHSFGVVAQLLCPLLNRAAIVVHRGRSGVHLLRELRQNRVTVLFGVSGHFHLLVQSARGRGAESRTALRYCAAGGGPLSGGLAEKFRRRFNLPLHHSYGLTEAAPIVTLTHEPQMNGAGPPLPNCRVRIVDEQRRPLRTGAMGRIEVRGQNVMLGYFKNPAATRTALPAGGWLMTNDLGRLDASGCLHVGGRSNDLICVNGQNVFPADVLDALLAYPGVRGAAVAGRPNEKSGEEIHAWLECAGSPDWKKLRAWCRRRLAPFQCPRRYYRVAELPRSPLQKVQAHRLESCRILESDPPHKQSKKTGLE